MNTPINESDLARKGFERGGLNITHLMAKRVCFAIADLFTHNTRSILIKGSLKSQESQQRKVDGAAPDGYEGDWSRLKDLVRTTILTKDDAAFNRVVSDFRRIHQDKMALNKEISRLYHLPFYKDHVYRDLTEDERRLLLSGAWEIMPNSFKQKQGKIDGYTDASVVLQNSTQHSVGGANQPATPNRAFGPGPARWVQTVRMEIQINVPNMIYGKQEEAEFLSMIPPPHGDRLFAELKAKTQIIGGLGHLFYEVARKNVLVAITQQLSKKYYEYIRRPKPGTTEYMSLCRAIAEYIDMEFPRKSGQPDKVVYSP